VADLEGSSRSNKELELFQLCLRSDFASTSSLESSLMLSKEGFFSFLEINTDVSLILYRTQVRTFSRELSGTDTNS